jgi:putative FmdB family regulatory protein
MPIYAYRCDSCGHAKDVLQKISDPLLTVCPACGAEQFKKQVTAAGFQLKGSGWYVTDFRGGATPAAGESGKDTGSSAGSEKSAVDKSTTDKSTTDKSSGDKAASTSTAAAAAAAPAPSPAPAAAPTPAAPASK